MKYKFAGSKLTRHEEGSALIELALIAPLLLVLLFGSVDLGRAFYYSNAVARAAEAGALYGAGSPTDTTGMIDASNDAMSYAFSSAGEMSGATTTASYGCECNNGEGQSASCSSTPSCTMNEVYYVTVTSNAKYTTLLPWPGIPSSINLSSTVTMRGE